LSAVHFRAIVVDGLGLGCPVLPTGEFFPILQTGGYFTLLHPDGPPTPADHARCTFSSASPPALIEKSSAQQFRSGADRKPAKKANQGGIQMAIFMMFGKYTSEALRGISPERTDQAVEIIKANGGKVVSMYAVMGEHDLVFTLDFPDAENAFATSVALNKLTGIIFTTSPVVEVEQFDKLISSAKEI
jgi:uncharacterized protein with GYD domain